MKYINRATGTIKTAVVQGKKQTPKKNIEEKNKLKEICLNCTRKVCRGCGKRWTKNGRKDL